jgi:hypothetical protein
LHELCPLLCEKSGVRSRVVFPTSFFGLQPPSVYPVNLKELLRSAGNFVEMCNQSKSIEIKNAFPCEKAFFYSVLLTLVSLPVQPLAQEQEPAHQSNHGGWFHTLRG